SAQECLPPPRRTPLHASRQSPAAAAPTIPGAQNTPRRRARAFPGCKAPLQGRHGTIHVGLYTIPHACCHPVVTVALQANPVPWGVRRIGHPPVDSLETFAARSVYP